MIVLDIHLTNKRGSMVEQLTCNSSWGLILSFKRISKQAKAKKPTKENRISGSVGNSRCL